MLNAVSYLNYLRTFVSCRLTREDRGVTAVEYGLLLALIAMVIVVAVVFLGQDLSNLFNNADSCVGGTAAGGTGTCP